MSLVSVVIPAYNAASYVCGAIDSVLRQSHQDFEILIVDDGSTDNTHKVVQPYLSDPRIRYLCKENGGPSPAKNMGAIASKGEYLAFLDADDFLAPNALEAMLRAFHLTKAAWLNVGLLKISGESRVVRHPAVPAGDLHLAILSDDFIIRSPIYPRQEFFAIGMFDLDNKGREDWDINIRMILADKRFTVIDEPLYQYTRTEGSLTTSNRRSWHINTEKLLRKHHKRLADAGDKEVARIYARNMWGLARQCFYETHEPREAMRCAWESLRYDRSLYRLVHPLIHKLAAVPKALKG
jgi:glycosyltransferase involved in cell wall biosynthesis